MTSENNKRIAKNTLLLYFRMLLTMGVSLYTVRIVLDTLGPVDYGIYDVVGGIVIMLSFFSGSMVSASQRYFSFELGKNDTVQLKKTFSTTMLIYALLGMIILILSETIGLWFLYNRMTIPPERMGAAFWVFQFSILSFLMNLFTLPYNAAIIAHENMKIYAYVSIVEVLLKLLIVYLLLLFSADKLKLYAILTFGVTTVVTFIYRTYCIRKYPECRFSFYWDKPLFRELLSYSGWNVFGGLAGVCNNQGINIVLNIFWGPVVNAAKGIAFQVNNAINQFVQNFMTATRPQIIKYYAAGQKDQMLKLVFQSSRFAFLLLFMISLPVMLETSYLFSLWLKEVPGHVVLFTRLILLNTWIDSFSVPLMSAAQATGKIRKYLSVVGGTMLLNLPVAWFALKLGYPPQTVFVITIVNSVICLFLRLRMLKQMLGLSVLLFTRQVTGPAVLCALVAVVIPFYLTAILEEGILRLLLTGLTGLITTAISICFIGITATERQFVFTTWNKFIHRTRINKKERKG